MTLVDEMRLGDIERLLSLIDAKNAEIERMRDYIGFLGHAVVATGGEIIIPIKQLQQCQYPPISREDDPVTGDIRLTVKLPLTP